MGTRPEKPRPPRGADLDDWGETEKGFEQIKKEIAAIRGENNRARSPWGADLGDFGEAGKVPCYLWAASIVGIVVSLLFGVVVVWAAIKYILLR